MVLAKDFFDELKQLKTDKDLDKLQKFFRGEDGSTKALGVKFGDIFKLSVKYMDMPPDEISKLLDSVYYEVRMGAVSIMDFQAKHKKTTPERKKELFELYLDRHDRLNNWDLVDRGAPAIIGEYLTGKPKDILYVLAKSKNTWERRTAIVATHAFIKKGQLEDTFNIAELLVHDNHDLINKAVGSWVREAGKKDEKKLLAFLDKFAATMPRTTLRYATEKLTKKQKDHYLK